MRKKTTVYLDEELLRAARVRAAREDKADYLVIEEALRRHLGRDVLERVWARAGLSEDEALDLANREVHASRQSSSRKNR